MTNKKVSFSTDTSSTDRSRFRLHAIDHPFDLLNMNVSETLHRITPGKANDWGSCSLQYPDQNHINKVLASKYPSIEWQPHNFPRTNVAYGKMVASWLNENITRCLLESEQYVFMLTSTGYDQRPNPIWLICTKTDITSIVVSTKGEQFDLLNGAIKQVVNVRKSKLVQMTIPEKSQPSIPCGSLLSAILLWAYLDGKFPSYVKMLSEAIRTPSDYSRLMYLWSEFFQKQRPSNWVDYQHPPREKYVAPTPPPVVATKPTEKALTTKQKITPLAVNHTKMSKAQFDKYVADQVAQAMRNDKTHKPSGPKLGVQKTTKAVKSPLAKNKTPLPKSKVSLPAKQTTSSVKKQSDKSESKTNMAKGKAKKSKAKITPAKEKAKPAKTPVKAKVTPVKTPVNPPENIDDKIEKPAVEEVIEEECVPMLTEDPSNSPVKVSKTETDEAIVCEASNTGAEPSVCVQSDVGISTEEPIKKQDDTQVEKQEAMEEDGASVEETPLENENKKEPIVKDLPKDKSPVKDESAGMESHSEGSSEDAGTGDESQDNTEKPSMDSKKREIDEDGENNPKSTKQNKRSRKTVESTSEKSSSGEESPKTEDLFE